MGFLEIKREELENLYAQDGITRKELRYLLRITPNQIPNQLSKFFKAELNPFKVSEQHEVSLRGFIHSPPKKLLEMFNSIHYQLLSEIDKYDLFLLSTSPLDLAFAIPVVIPKKLVSKRKLSQAQFALVSGSVHDFTSYKSDGQSAFFIIAKEIFPSGFDELFSLSEPALKLRDFSEMIRDRFNTPELITKSILAWFMSSPVYQGRVGGNAFSPISPFDNNLKCNPSDLKMFHKDLLSIPLPYFTPKKSLQAKYNYNLQMKSKLKYFKAPELNYHYEENLVAADEFLKNRKPSTTFSGSELNLSTTTLILDSIKTRPLESFVQKPLVPAKVLTRTDLPILFTIDELAIDDSETELLDYSMELTQLIYQSHLKFHTSPFDSMETFEAVKHLMDNLQKTSPELHELMLYGIIFDTSPIGGLGEHLTRISNSILRSNAQLSNQETLSRAEELFTEIINNLFNEFDKPIKDLYYNLEEIRTERDQIKTHRLRTTINSILFELNNTYPDGWKRELFEVELKKRSSHGLAKIKEIFFKLINQKEVTEHSPGLYKQIVGFDRYL